jgi:hypothetical protein
MSSTRNSLFYFIFVSVKQLIFIKGVTFLFMLSEPDTVCYVDGFGLNPSLSWTVLMETSSLQGSVLGIAQDQLTNLRTTKSVKWPSVRFLVGAVG